VEFVAYCNYLKKIIINKVIQTKHTHLTLGVLIFKNHLIENEVAQGNGSDFIISSRNYHCIVCQIIPVIILHYTYYVSTRK